MNYEDLEPPEWYIDDPAEMTPKELEELRILRANCGDPADYPKYDLHGVTLSRN